MTFCVGLVSLAVFFVLSCLMRPAAERLVLGKAEHANPDRFSKRLSFQWSLV